MLDLPAALRQVLRHVIKNRGAIMSRGPGPARGFPRGFDRVANVLAVAQPYFADELAALTSDSHAVAGIRARLFAPDIKFYGAVDIKDRRRGLRFVARSPTRRLRGGPCRRVPAPRSLHEFPPGLPPPLSPRSPF